MKRIIVFLTAMLLISISALNAQAQTWANYETPAEVSAVAVSASSLSVFGQTNYFTAPLPLPPNPNNIVWTTSDLPVGITNVSQAGFVNDEIFILSDDQLWSKNGTDPWHFHFNGVSNMQADGKRLFVWFNNVINIYTGTQWILDGAPAEITALAFEGENILTFDENHTMYRNGSYWNAFEDLEALEVTLANDTYTAVGTVVGGYAAYYTSNINQSFKYIHVLSLGELTSVASARGHQYAAGQLNNKGVIFDVADLSDYTVFDSPILQIRSNGGTVAAIDANHVYVREGQITSVPGFMSTKAKDLVTIAPNPITSNQLRFMSELDTDAAVFNQLGSTVAKFKVTAGINTCTLNLPAGIYFLRTATGETEKFIVH